ncbi:hypothetical protein LOK49_LG04G02343 [Camellia lanceoleosa]|uniref:Uncharacterized protein n=1 Tax=Camellia lanceoleosa TaxID=1840588 RepID=A0ACC0I4R8_9ERIC|nr:hypothetical protein LOK49_LG04G02343 [Camellia lanceoleosa]
MLEGKAVEEKESAAKALASMMGYAKSEDFQEGRERIVSTMIAARPHDFLQKLVEMDVEGAKKLLESLGRSKIWGVFARS